MKTFLAAAILAALSAPAQAACGGIYLPPAEFDHEPTVPYLSQRMDWRDIPAYCGPRVERDPRIGRLWGCSFRSAGGAWIVVVPRPGAGGFTDQETSCMARHENGHVNGWGPQHPGARFD